MKGCPTKFMVTDGLRVLPLSLASTVKIASEAKIQTESLVEKETTLTKSQVSSSIPAVRYNLIQQATLDYSLGLFLTGTWNRLWSYKGLSC